MNLNTLLMCMEHIGRAGTAVILLYTLWDVVRFLDEPLFSTARFSKSLSISETLVRQESTLP
tara:strand:- start:235 stop:420 length:186 start_codon:yes stop_codon:yes gene_type:complete